MHECLELEELEEHSAPSSENSTAPAAAMSRKIFSLKVTVGENAECPGGVCCIQSESNEGFSRFADVG
jgi:hypothetical protein